jgi:hypothetical protein
VSTRIEVRRHQARRRVFKPRCRGSIGFHPGRAPNSDGPVSACSSDIGDGSVFEGMAVRCSPIRLRQPPATVVLARGSGVKVLVSKFGEKRRELRGHVNGGKSPLATSAGIEGADKAMEDRYGQLWDFTLVPHPPSAIRAPSPTPAAQPLLV